MVSENSEIQNLTRGGMVSENSEIQNLTRGGVVSGVGGRDSNIGIIPKSADIINPSLEEKITKPLNQYYFGKDNNSKIQSLSELKGIKDRELGDFTKNFTKIIRPKDQEASEKIINLASGSNLSDADIKNLSAGDPFSTQNKSQGTRDAVDSLLQKRDSRLSTDNLVVQPKENQFKETQNEIQDKKLDNNKLEPKDKTPETINKTDNITNNISININVEKDGGVSESISGAENAGVDENELAQKIKSAVLNVIREEKRPGGELN